MPNKKFTNRLSRVHILGYVLRVAKEIVRAPTSKDEMRSTLEAARIESESMKKALSNYANDVESLTSRVQSLLTIQDNLSHELADIKITHSHSHTVNSTERDSGERLFAEDHALDVFYANFEDKFRGTEGLIADRLRVYTPFFTKKNEVNFSKNPVLDIGSGRGEFLQLLSDNEIRSKGLDINHDMVKRAKAKGLNVIQGDAVSHLAGVKPQTYGAITGFHIVEHIPFGTLLSLISSAYTALIENGFVIFETPNPENVVVGSNTFYMDPSHLHPLPPPLLAFALEVSGFRNVEIKYLHPATQTEDTTADNLPPDLQRRLYGPQDYAVIGYK